MPRMNYNPLSTDAQLAAILERLSAQDKTLQSILEQVKYTNGRVSKLEQESHTQKRVVVILSSAISVAIGIAGFFFKH